LADAVDGRITPVKNPVVFPDIPKSEDLTVYSDSLSEFAWSNRIVGVTKSGFLYVDEKVPRKGYYEFHPKTLDWSKIQEVKIDRFIDLKGIVIGSRSPRHPKKFKTPKPRAYCRELQERNECGCRGVRRQFTGFWNSGSYGCLALRIEVV
jgi:hypothetical protein